MQRQEENTTTNVKEILGKHGSRLALMIGNGVNLYNNSSSINSWEAILVGLAKEHLPPEQREVPKGVSFTEFYDVLELKSTDRVTEKSLQREFCDAVSDWQPFDHHRRIILWAQRHDAPVLTTNFEHVLAEAGGCRLYRTTKGGFTAYYPWESYYGTKVISDPASEFGIWHINGMACYRQSIRLGLTHYMGSVERARNWLLNDKRRKLYSPYGSAAKWKGSKTWLHVIFNVPLLIFGLGLGENEVFLRWLLIERARYFKEFPERRKDAWYVCGEKEIDAGKKFFFEGIGINVVAADFDETYGEEIWCR